MPTSFKDAHMMKLDKPAAALGAILFGLLAVALPSAADAATTTPNGIWLSYAEIAKLPMSGKAWDKVKSAADGWVGTPNIADQDSKHDVNTLAIALVYARTGNPAYRTKAAAAIMSAVGTEAGGRTLALSRNLVSYVIAADLIDLRTLDATQEQKFRTWLTAVRNETLDGKTLISTHEIRPNNWGTHAGASRIAVAMYLGDTVDLERAARVFKGWLGDRSAYSNFEYGDLSWQMDPKNPVGVNPVGATKEGHSIDGALPDDMRRGCSFKWQPCTTGYAWEAMQGAVVEAQLLARAGYDAWNWGDKGIARATMFLYKLNQEVGSDWWATGDDAWQPWIINKAYHANFPTTAAKPGKNMAWTDWTHGS
jgi:hypothetical protein